MAISRLFVEIGEKVDRIGSSLRQSMEAADKAGIKIEASGKRILRSFDDALNPTRKLGEQLELLEKTGKSNSEIWAVYGKRLEEAAATARKYGQEVDPLVRKHLELNRATDKTKLSFKGMMESLSGTQKLFLGLGAAFGASRLLSEFKNFVSESTRLAMDAIESENLFAVSMGALTNRAVQWSQDLGKTLGLNQYELRKNIGTFNVMFGAMGIGTEKAYEMSSSLTKLAYDFASFYNLRPDEAFEKLRAGITGEAEPLKRLGILVDETTIKNYAYRTGLVEVGKQLTQQEKVQARYGSILEQTAKAQGDLARTLDSPTNQLRIMRTRFEELETNIGMGFIPLLQSGIQFVNGFTGSINGAGSSLQIFAKIVASPVMVLNLLGVTFNKVRLWANEVDLWFAEKNPLRNDELIAQIKGKGSGLQEEIDRYEKQITDLMISVDRLGKFDYAAAQAGLNNFKLPDLTIPEKPESKTGLTDLEKNFKLQQQDREAAFQRLIKSSEDKFVIPLFEYEIPEPPEELPEWIEKLGEDFQKAQRPLETLLGEFANLNLAGVDNADILRQNSQRILEAAAAQEKYGITLSDNEQKWVAAAQALEDYNQRLGKSEKQLRDIFLQETRSRLQEGSGGAEDVAVSALGKFVEDYEGIQVGLADSFGEFFDTLGNGFAKAIFDTENLGEALLSLGRDAIGGLLSSLVRLGLQWVINATIMKAMNKGIIAETATEAGATAAAWAPAAALASLATLGGNAAPAAIALSSTSAISLGIATLSQLGKFASGGLVAGGQQAILVNEAGPEFVMNSKATRDFLPLLRSLNAGTVPSGRDSAPTFDIGTRSAPALNVSIQNFGTGKDFEVERIDESTVRIICRDEIRKNVPSVIAGDLSNPNSKTSKAIAQHTTARRNDR